MWRRSLSWSIKAMTRRTPSRTAGTASHTSTPTPSISVTVTCGTMDDEHTVPAANSAARWHWEAGMTPRLGQASYSRCKAHDSLTIPTNGEGIRRWRWSGRSMCSPSPTAHGFAHGGTAHTAGVAHIVRPKIEGARRLVIRGEIVRGYEVSPFPWPPASSLANRSAHPPVSTKNARRDSTVGPASKGSRAARKSLSPGFTTTSISTTRTTGYRKHGLQHGGVVQSERAWDEYMMVLGIEADFLSLRELGYNPCQLHHDDGSQTRIAIISVSTASATE
ncbi:hypothetical protein D9611_013701 [Ephemerocybe angulata]|uniref:Uncharacterized protein n=1 Tax=Ephemerocybe angulata TaxID=980116 RepID=A0A8H5F0B3_9AGAR|nr:hypothetical protein D9611_013701 [Tulosesus angulatus]